MNDFRQRANQIGRRNFKDDLLEDDTPVGHVELGTGLYRDINFHTKDAKDDTRLHRLTSEKQLVIDKTVQLRLEEEPRVILGSSSRPELATTALEEPMGSGFSLLSPSQRKKSKSNVRLVPERSDSSKSVALTPLQEEYNTLAQRLKETERNAEMNTAKNSQELARIETAYNSLAHEQTQLIASMKQNEEQLRRSAGAATAEMLQEKAALRERLELMERDRVSMEEALRASEAKAREEARVISDQLTREKQQLQGSLARLEEEKMEMARSLEQLSRRYHEQEALLSQRLEAEKAKYLSTLHESKAQESVVLARQQEDFARLAAGIEAEKAALLRQAEVARQELLVNQQRTEKMLREEKQQLESSLTQLREEAEALRVQREETARQAELERRHKAEELQRLQEETRRAEMQQAAAEEKLQAEKQELLAIISSMRSENATLQQQVASSSVDHELTLQQQRADYERNMQKIHEDKEALERLVGQIEQRTGEASQSYARSNEELKAQMEAMQREREALTVSLQSLGETTREQAQLLERQLQQEKEELRVKMEVAAAEKRVMERDLMDKERLAQERVAAVARELELANAARLEEERVRLAHELESKEQRHQEALQNAAKLAEELKSVEQQKQAMAEERDRLAVIAQENERKAKETQESVNAILSKEREELMALVNKMKNDFLAEQQRKMAESPSALHSKSSHKLLGTRLNTKTSLFNILQEQAEEELIEVDDRSIRPIMEKDEKSSADEYEEAATERRDSSASRFSDLAAPHALAASGNLRLLREMERAEAYLLCSLDEASRSPLFYAAANDQPEVVQYLCGLWPETVFYKDIHGDTALHAAASAGSSRCMQILLGLNHTQPENNMGMTATHMCPNTECLQVLYEYGYDFKALDFSGRTPLFVNCALNRIDCAQFILDCLEAPEACLILQDSRGDTALHAAACNGSVDCLLLLLQFAVDPSIKNNKGHTAVDLAIKKKQTHCVKMLAEYTLHFTTSSDFDSMFFLAAIEGHNKIQELKRSLDEYDIIQSSLSPKSSSHRMLGAKKESLFSINTNRSIRLQRWGSWIAYEDQVTKKIFWYNQSTSEGHWDKPARVTELQQKNPESFHATTHDKSSMKLKKNGDWIEYITEFGHNFYYNEKNGKFQWTDPNSSEPRAAAAQEESPWRPYKDPDSGAIFWYNHETNVSQWDCPFPNGNGVPGADDDHEAVVVNNFDDLGI